MLDENAIVLVNNSANQVNYELKKVLDAEWLSQSLEANHKITYQIQREEELYIRVCTSQNEEDKCVSYQLERLKRYQIYWNQNDKRWDVAEIKDQ
jgi:hypothetical protein